MKKTGLQAAAVMLALVMAFAMAGCGSGKTAKEEQKETTAATQEQSSAQTQAESTEKPKEPITLKLYGQQFAVSVPSGVQTDEVAKEIARITGVTMDIDTQVDDQKFKAMMASGDLPDIMVIKQIKDLETLIEGGNVLELDGLVKSNASHLLTELPGVLDYSRKYYSKATGKLYAVPGYINTGALHLQANFYIRWDYYKELGFPALNTEDDLINMLAEMQKKHPTNEEGKKVYGLSPFGFEAGWGTWPYNTAASAVDLLTGQSAGLGLGNMEYDFGTGEIISILDDRSNFWQGAQFYNKAKKAGILDPDALTQKYDNALQKYQANKALCSLVDWPVMPSNQAFEKAGQKLNGYIGLPPKEGTPSALGGWAAPVGTPDRLWCISSKCQAPERAMDLIGYIFSYEGSRTIHSGVMGKNYTEENGKLKVADEFLKQRKEDPNFMLTNGAGKYLNWAGYGVNIIDPKYGQQLDLMQEPEMVLLSMTDLQKDYFSHYGVKTEDELIRKRVALPLQNYMIFSLLAAAPDDVKRIDDKIGTYLLSEGPKLILAKTDEEFAAQKAKMVKAITDMGIEQSNTFWLKNIQDAVTEMGKYK